MVRSIPMINTVRRLQACFRWWLGTQNSSKLFEPPEIGRQTQPFSTLTTNPLCSIGRSVTHMQNVFSSVTMLECLPVGNIATEKSGFKESSKVSDPIWPVSASQIRIVLSSEPETTRLPSGENATE